MVEHLSSIVQVLVEQGQAGIPAHRFVQVQARALGLGLRRACHLERAFTIG